MKRIALFIALCILTAAGVVGVQAWGWRERKIEEGERIRAQSEAEQAAAGRLGLKTQPLPPDPLERRLALGEGEIGRVAELPDFAELMNALVPLAREWVAANKVNGKALRIRAVRGHKEAFAAIREAQTRWSRGDHGAA